MGKRSNSEYEEEGEADAKGKTKNVPSEIQMNAAEIMAVFKTLKEKSTDNAEYYCYRMILDAREGKSATESRKDNDDISAPSMTRWLLDMKLPTYSFMRGVFSSEFERDGPHKGDSPITNSKGGGRQNFEEGYKHNEKAWEDGSNMVPDKGGAKGRVKQTQVLKKSKRVVNPPQPAPVPPPQPVPAPPAQSLQLLPPPPPPQLPGEVVSSDQQWTLEEADQLSLTLIVKNNELTQTIRDQGRMISDLQGRCREQQNTIAQLQQTMQALKNGNLKLLDENDVLKNENHTLKRSDESVFAFEDSEVFGDRMKVHSLLIQD